jgi:hypothetical protein
MGDGESGKDQRFVEGGRDWENLVWNPGFEVLSEEFGKIQVHENQNLAGK